MAKILRYFLGANSPQGFISRFDQLGNGKEGWRCCLLKGSPGCGKSTLMERLSRTLEPYCGVIEEIHCTSDPTSLDGVIFPEHRLAIMDGTPPHALEPKYPGVYEDVVSLWGCLDRDMLRGAKEEIIALTEAEEGFRKGAAGYLYAAGALLGELSAMGATAMDRSKIRLFAKRLALREFPHGEQRRGREQVRLLSAVTGRGLVCMDQTPGELASRIVAIEDGWGAASAVLLEELRELALASGVDVVTCRCPLFPFTKIDHLLLPQLDLAFVTVNKFTPEALAKSAQRTIHARRFCDETLLKRQKNRGDFLRKAAAGMLEQACVLLGRSLDAHRQLEVFYRDAMDFAALEEITSRLSREFLEKIHDETLP